MSAKSNETKVFWLGLGPLVIVGLFLGFTAAGSMRGVLQSRAVVGSPSAEASGASGQGKSLLAEKDAQVAAAAPGDRDPFRDPPPLRSAGVPASRAGQQETKEVPICSGLLYDNVSPLVELTASSGSSGWLHKGDTFLGWTIVQISAKSVTIAKGSESVVLRSP